MNVLIFYPSGNNSNVTQPVSYSPCWRRYRSILSTAVPKTMSVFIWSFFLLDVIRSSAKASAAARFVVNWKLDRCSRRQKLWDAHSTRVSNFANGNTSSIAAILFYFAFCNTCNNLYWFGFFFLCKHTAPCNSVHTPWDFEHFVMLGTLAYFCQDFMG